MDESHVSQYNRRYYKEHREEIALRRLNKRHKDKGVPLLTMEEWGSIKTAQDGKCFKCRQPAMLIPFLITTPKIKYAGCCKTCGSKMALEMANESRQAIKEARLNKEAEKYD